MFGINGSKAAAAYRITKLQLMTCPSKEFPIFNQFSFPARLFLSENVNGWYMAVGRWSFCRSQVVASLSNRLGGTMTQNATVLFSTFYIETRRISVKWYGMCCNKYALVVPCTE